MGDLKMNLMETSFISFLVGKGVICQEDVEKMASSNGAKKEVSSEVWPFLD